MSLTDTTYMFDVNPYKALKLLALDPGLNNIGVAYYNIDIENRSIIDITAYTIRSHKVPERSDLDEHTYTERAIKKQNMMAALARILDDFQPDIVSCESPFFDRRKPGSYGVLVEVLSGIQETIMAYDRRVLLHMVEPLLVKNTLKVAGQKGKEVVKEGMLKCSEIMAVLRSDIAELDDHAVDAIAVGYTWLVRKTDILR